LIDTARANKPMLHPIPRPSSEGPKSKKAIFENFRGKEGEQQNRELSIANVTLQFVFAIKDSRLDFLLHQNYFI